MFVDAYAEGFVAAGAGDTPPGAGAPAIDYFLRMNPRRKFDSEKCGESIHVRLVHGAQIAQLFVFVVAGVQVE